MKLAAILMFASAILSAHTPGTDEYYKWLKSEWENQHEARTVVSPPAISAPVASAPAVSMPEPSVFAELGLSCIAAFGLVLLKRRA